MTGQKPSFRKLNNERVLLLILLILSIAASVTKTLIGFDIDEGYAVSMPFRLIQGDHLFKEMLEVHQTSSFLPGVFIWIFIHIMGTTEGIVIFLRVMAALMHALISLSIFAVLRTVQSEETSAFSALLFYNFLPKWLMNFDFSMQQLWGITLTLLLLYLGLKKDKMIYLLGGGILLAGTVLSYPGMIVTYPFFLLTIWKCSNSEKVKSKINKMLIFTLGCLGVAVLFFAIVLSHVSWTEFLHNVEMVFMDGSHQFTFAVKMETYAKQWLNLIKQAGVICIPILIITVAIKIWKKKVGLLTVLLVFLAVTSGGVIFANLFRIEWGPFYLQVRYLILFLLGWIMVFIDKKTRDISLEGRFYRYGILLLMTGMFVGILLASNVGPDASSSYLAPAIIAIIIYIKNAVEKQKSPGINKISHVILFAFAVSIIFCKGYYVRITEYGPSNILEQRVEMQSGPLRGIYVLPQEALRYTEDYNTIQDNTEPGDRMLFLGTEGIQNLSANCRFVSPTTISTPAFNEQWRDYFQEYQDLQPSVIFIAKNTIDNRKKFFTYNPFGIWIADHYDTDDMMETDSLCVIRKKTGGNSQ